MQSERNRSSLSIHEAGHAVTMHHFGITLYDVRIYPAVGCYPCQGATTCDATAVSALCDDDQAVIILAGFVADRCQDGRAVAWQDVKSSNKYGSDERKLKCILLRCLPVDRDENDDDILDRPVEKWLSRTTAVICETSRWRAIMALAEALDEHHKLSGKAATAIIEAYLSAA